MKRFIVLLALLLTSCTTPTTKLISGDNFQFEIPANLKTFDYEEDCDHIYAIGNLRFVVFQQCWVDSTKVEMYDFEETYNLFREKFVKGEKIYSNIYNNRIVETVNYTKLNNDFLYQPKSETGTVAIWRKGVNGYALIDENNEYQKDGTFENIINNFEFLDN